MNKTTIIIAVAIVAAAAYYYYDKQQNAGALGDDNTTPPNTGGGGTIPTPPTPPTPPISTQPIYRRGSSGVVVQQIQRAINRVRARAAADGISVSPALTEDGNFGQLTESALLQFYGYAQIRPTDYIDPRWRMISYPSNWLMTYIRY
jgi:hypothetical protein